MTGEEALARIRKSLQRSVDETPAVKSLIEKIRSGKATYQDTALYARWAATNLGLSLSHVVCDIDLSDRAAVCKALLLDQYEDINGFIDMVQAELDSRFGIQLAPHRAPFNDERADTIGHSLADTTRPDEVIRRRAQSATATATKAIHDDRMKAEARFRSRAGLKCHITRTAVGGCCPWCSDVAGRYEYGEEPDDIYRRHDNCDCTVTFENGRQRQDVWSKRTWEAPEPGAGAKEPARLTPEQAAAKEAEHLPKRLTQGAESGRIRLSDSDDYWHPITENAIQSVPRVSAFSDDLNAVVQKQCRELLSSLIEDDIGTEGTVSISLQDFTTETAKGVSGEGGVKPIRLNKPYISIHNHPSDDTFSALDLRLLCIDEQCKAIIVVGNSGKTVFVLQKTESFDPDGMLRHIRARIDRGNPDETLEEFVKGCERYGTKYHK